MVLVKGIKNMLVIYKSQLIHTYSISKFCFRFKYYGMTTLRRRGLVINNKKYKDLPNSIRKGSKFDVENIITLPVKENLSGEVSYSWLALA